MHNLSMEKKWDSSLFREQKMCILSLLTHSELCLHMLSIKSSDTLCFTSAAFPLETVCRWVERHVKGLEVRSILCF